MLLILHCRAYVMSHACRLLLFSCLLAGASFVALAQPPAPTPGTDCQDVNSKAPTETRARIPTVSEARRQAEVLHTAIHSTLRVVHDRYFHVDAGLPIPASILKEVFRDLETEQHVKLRWLAVEGQPMNVDHKPQDSFEQEAVIALKARRPFHEQVLGGTYRRAASITLSNHCLKCHVPDRRSLQDRTAGLIIQIETTGD